MDGLLEWIWLLGQLESHFILPPFLPAWKKKIIYHPCCLCRKDGISREELLEARRVWASAGVRINQFSINLGAVWGRVNGLLGLQREVPLTCFHNWCLGTRRGPCGTNQHPLSGCANRWELKWNGKNNLKKKIPTDPHFLQCPVLSGWKFHAVATKLYQGNNSSLQCFPTHVFRILECPGLNA